MSYPQFTDLRLEITEPPPVFVFKFNLNIDFQNVEKRVVFAPGEDMEAGGTVSAKGTQGSELVNGDYYSTQDITLKATPNPGYGLEGWYSDPSCNTKLDGTSEADGFKTNNEKPLSAYAKFIKLPPAGIESRTSGSIIGVDDTMEYRLKEGGGDWTSVVGTAVEDITTGGIYEVRYKQNGGIAPSDSADVFVMGKITDIKITGIDAPVPGKALDTKAEGSGNGVKAADYAIVWDPSDTIAKPGTAYKASVMLEAQDGYGFAADTITSRDVTVNGIKAFQVGSTAGVPAGTGITVSHPFLIPNSGDFAPALSDKTYNGQAQGIAVNTKDGVTGMGDITAVYYEGESPTVYGKSQLAPKDAGTYRVTADVAGGAGYQAAEGLWLGNYKITPKTLADYAVVLPKVKRDGKKQVSYHTLPVASAEIVAGDHANLTGCEVTYPSITKAVAAGEEKVYDDASVLFAGIDNSNYAVSDTSLGGQSYTVTEKKLLRLYVEKEPNKTVYFTGETFSTAGMRVMAEWDSGDDTDVTAETAISPSGPLTEKDAAVTLAYGGKEVTQKISVRARNASNIPQTGDTANPQPWLLVMLSSLAGVTSLFIYRKLRYTKHHG